MSFSLLNTLQKKQPVYNPMVYAFSSSNYAQPGFKYVVDIYSASTSTKFGRYRINPLVDGTGYVDLSRILSNYISVDFNPTTTGGTLATNSFVNFDFKVGEEYKIDWSYADYQYPGVSAGIYDDYTLLNQISSATTHTYVVGDQINISTISTGITASVNGLHTVVSVPSPYSIIIDLEYPGAGPTIGGTISYADNRKTIFPALASDNNKIAFNAAMSFKDYPSFLLTDYDIKLSSSATTRALTNQPVIFYATPDQDLWFNYSKSSTDSFYINILYKNSNGDILQMDKWWESPSKIGTIRQVPVGPNNAEATTVISGTTGLIKDDTEWYEWYTNANTLSASSRTYRVYIDRRCKIEDYEIAFIDKMGSISSFAFQLRSKEQGSIKREQYKQQIGSFNGSKWTYNSYDQGTTNYWVEVEKTLTLNTNWMNDDMSIYFEELLTSPNTWVKIDGSYYACIIEDSSFEVQRQKNKFLIKKTVTVKLSNDNAINI